MKTLRFALPLAIFLILCVLFYATLDRDTQLLPSPLIGQPVPEFTLPRLFENAEVTATTADSPQVEQGNLNQHNINQDSFQGEKWAINIWASWCAACRIEHPYFNQIAEQTDWKLIGLNYKDKSLEAKQWLQEMKNPYQDIIYDHEGSLGLDLGVYGVPETFLIDAQGIVQYKHVGPICKTIIKEVIEPFFLDQPMNTKASCQ